MDMLNASTSTTSSAYPIHRQEGAKEVYSISLLAFRRSIDRLIFRRLLWGAFMVKLEPCSILHRLLI